MKQGRLKYRDVGTPASKMARHACTVLLCWSFVVATCTLCSNHFYWNIVVRVIPVAALIETEIGPGTAYEGCYRAIRAE